jgi:hypothetical protein
MNAANDLEEFGPLNANQMENIGSSRDVNIVIQFKRIQGLYDTSDGDWGGTRRYYITRDDNSGHVSSTILSTQATLDMGNPQTLQDFVQWGTKTFPADRLGLVVWNHGAGWRSRKPAAVSRSTGRGVSYDDEFESHIDTIELPAALNIGDGRKWDLLAWDSSLMQMVEVAYEIRDKASYIVGSEESPPGTGYPYDQILGELVVNPTMDPKTLGILFAQKMLAVNGTGSKVTQSVLDTSKVAALAPALDNLGGSLSAAQSFYNTEIADARDATENYAYRENRDLIDFLNQLSITNFQTGRKVSDDAAVSSGINQVRQAVNGAVVFNNHGNAHPRSNGIAIFLPSPSGFQQIDDQQAAGFGQRYTTLSFASAAPNWKKFISGEAL